MIPVKEWIKLPEIQELKKQLFENPGKFLTTTFFRNPIRGITFSRNHFLAYADGTITFVAEKVLPKEKILDVKGRNLRVVDLLQDESYNHTSLVISTFLSCLDVHIVRMPISGKVVEIRETEPLKTYNLSMTLLENDIFEGLISPFRLKKDIEYLFLNERTVIKLFSTEWGQEFYIVEIADREVDNLLFFVDEEEYLDQGERLSWVVWGSECVLIIPRKRNLKYEILAKPLYHVEAGRDPILKISKR